MLVMYPADAQKRAQLGALHCSRIEAQNGSEWTAALLIDVGMPMTLITSCAVTWAGRAASPVTPSCYIVKHELNNM